MFHHDIHIYLCTVFLSMYPRCTLDTHPAHILDEDFYHKIHLNQLFVCRSHVSFTLSSNHILHRFGSVFHWRHYKMMSWCIYCFQPIFPILIFFMHHTNHSDPALYIEDAKCKTLLDNWFFFVSFSFFAYSKIEHQTNIFDSVFTKTKDSMDIPKWVSLQALSICEEKNLNVWAEWRSSNDHILCIIRWMMRCKSIPFQNTLPP